jgi:hypothetical protein
MEGLARLVDNSLARHGIETAVDHRRLHWSRWVRCESSLSFVLVPSQPGVFALAEEVLAPGESASTGGKRMLALYKVAETDDLAMALGRLFLPGTADRTRLTGGRCFARYAVIGDLGQRRYAYKVFNQWLSVSAETASGVGNDDVSVPFPGGESHPVECGEAQTEVARPASLPLGF